jgi:hypothetical protein
MSFPEDRLSEMLKKGHTSERNLYRTYLQRKINSPKFIYIHDRLSWARNPSADEN